MTEQPSSKDLLIAAVALDEAEWKQHVEEICEWPKQTTADLLIELFTGGIPGELETPGDVESALLRLATLVAAVMRVPARAKTLRNQGYEPAHAAATPAEMAAFRRLFEGQQAGVAQAVKHRDLAAFQALAAQAYAAIPWMTEARQEAHAPPDLELSRRMFVAFVETFRAWFNRTDWNGGPVSSSCARDVLDEVLSMPHLLAWRVVIHPMLRDLTGTITEPETRAAVQDAVEGGSR